MEVSNWQWICGKLIDFKFSLLNCPLILLPSKFYFHFPGKWLPHFATRKQWHSGCNNWLRDMTPSVNVNYGSYWTSHRTDKLYWQSLANVSIRLLLTKFWSVCYADITNSMRSCLIVMHNVPESFFCCMKRWTLTWAVYQMFAAK